MKVCFFLTNPYSQDTRIIKQCSALRELGYDVVVIAYKRIGFKDEETTPDGTRIIRTHATWRYAIKAVAGCLQEQMKYLLPSAAAKRVRDRARRLRQRVIAWVRRALGWFRAGAEQELGEDIPQSVRDAKMTELAFTRGQKVLIGVALLFSPILVVLGVLVVMVRVGKAAIRKMFHFMPRRSMAPRNLRFVISLFLTRSFLAFAAHGVRVNADIYQSNDPETLLVAWFCAKLRRRRLVYDSHELYDECFPVRKPLSVRFAIRVLEGTFARRADAVLTVNDSIAEILQRRYSLKEKPVVVRNVQPYQERLTTFPHLLRKAIGDSRNDKVLFVYAGRITRGRGLEQTVTAMAQADPRAALVMIGTMDPAMGRTLQELIDKNRLGGRVAVIPPVPSEELAGVLGAADVGLMLTETVALSYFYGLGNKLFHYIQAGLPVVVPDHPEKRRIVDTYDVGWWIGQVTPKAITKMINRIVDNPGELERKKQDCLIAAKQLCWEREKAQYEKVYIDMYELELYRNDVYRGVFSWRP